MLFESSPSYRHAAHRKPHSFPTRRSSDLDDNPGGDSFRRSRRPRRRVKLLLDEDVGEGIPQAWTSAPLVKEQLHATDRKSTRLNSSHQIISYAVFCLKKNIREPTAPG